MSAYILWKPLSGDSESMGPEAKTSTTFFWHIFINFKEKQPLTKFCGAYQFSRSFEVTNS